MTTRLVDDKLGTLLLDEAHGYVVTEVDLGFPVVRSNSVDRVNANGADDSTLFYGARAVAVTVQVFASDDGSVSRRHALDSLRAYASPVRRPVLVFDDEGDGSERQITLRGNQLSWPLSNGRLATVRLAWEAPDGIIEDAVESSQQATASLDQEPGRTYNRVYSLTYPAFSVSGAVDCSNAGNEPAAPLLQLYGPCVDPYVENLSTGEGIYFSGLTLTAEQYAEVDVKAATVRLNGDAAQSIYGQLDFSKTVLWWLAPASNYVRYGASSFDAGAHAVITYRSAWL